ncbi:hypothetical protein CAEBREN_23605 [Caenorhabditis brenneri]|uniref:Uncharacterized protein n=1 Tax=Caenorhabditis brenneri TaxID=135651 RepID=G0MIM8_CAEBE|nr:hypothetical protein CAEBREN_23605 [Caenorhabditis brenneri]
MVHPKQQLNPTEAQIDSVLPGYDRKRKRKGKNGLLITPQTEVVELTGSLAVTSPTLQDFNCFQDFF